MARSPSAAPARVPLRTCVGCRERAPRAALLRVVAVEAAGPVPVLRPDPRRVLPGRGASLHPDPACLALAERRRAFARALRLDRAPDTALVAAHLAEAGAAGPHDRHHQHDPSTTDTREQVESRDERSMNSPR